MLALEEGDPSTASSEAGKAEPLVSAQNFGSGPGFVGSMPNWRSTPGAPRSGEAGQRNA